MYRPAPRGSSRGRRTSRDGSGAESPRGAALDQRVADRQAEVIPDRGRGADREQPAAGLDELCGAPAPCATPTRCPSQSRNSAGNALRSRLSAAARRRASGMAPSTKISTSNLLAQVAGVERLRKHDLERELELLEQPARPAGRHRSAVGVPQADAHRAQRRPSRDRRPGRGRAPRSSAPCPRPAFCRIGSVVAFAGAMHRAGRIASGRPPRSPRGSPETVLVGLQQPVHGDERVVHLRAEDVAAALRRRREASRRRRDRRRAPSRTGRRSLRGCDRTRSPSSTPGCSR